ncbi:MAG: prepilin-type N-terminal cleavage/methylation domain-containing protein [Candidatus Omnitrophica bacterium]|nr:prepilin-type N-terminal cleavage/methylation domain-containing protein [Candidatus Omnitrophota bacterium]
MRSLRESQRGFTLLELLMVVIIIAILASIALPQYIRATEKARAAEALQLLGTIRSAEGRYKAQSPTNVYTATAADLDMIDPANPLTTKSWGIIPTNLTLTANSASLARTGGAYATKVLGITHAVGTVCGNFAVSAGLDPTAVACP